MLHWVQGMRDPDDVDESQPWMRVLFYRLNAQFTRIPSGTTTEESERILELDRSVYYYVGYCHPDFGELVVAHLGSGAKKVAEAAVTPFDTGGLAQNWVVATTGNLSDKEKADLVRENSYSRRKFWRALKRWIKSAFVASSDYVEGKQPADPAVPVIDIKAKDSDARSWVWEGRVPAKDYDEYPLVPTRIYAEKRKRREYLDWLRESRIVLPEQIGAYIRQANELFTEADLPVVRMQQYLTGRELA